MKVKFRRSCQDDLESVYELHTKCFASSDQWYKSNIKHYLDNGIIIELKNKLIGVLLQGPITACNQKFNIDELDEQIHKVKSGYQEDIFEPINETGTLFLKNNIHFKELYGIVMICIQPEFRGKGLAKKLIDKHFQDTNNHNHSKVICLNTRKTNINAYLLYKKMGYQHIAYIKNKYFFPNEDSIFMIKDLSETTNN